MHSFRRVLGIAGAALLLVLVGLAIAVWTVDPNQFVGPILARVKAATGREVTIGGGVELEIAFRPTLVANDVRVGNATWGRAPHLLSAKELAMQVALLPLLQRRFELVRLTLVEPVIALETNGEGRGNWELGPAPGATAPTSASGPGGLAISDFAITRGVLTYRDGPAGSDTRIAIDALAISASDANSPIDAEFRGTIDETAVVLAGKLGSFAALSDRRAPYPVSVQGEIAGRKTAVSVVVHRDDKLVALKDVDVTVGSSNVKGRVDIRGEGKQSEWTVNLGSSAFDLRDLPAPPPAASGTKRAASRFVFSDEPIPFDLLRGRNANGEVTVDRLALADGRMLAGVHAKFALRDGKLDVPAIRLAAYGGTISGSLAVDTTRGRAPAIALRLEGRDLDLAALLAAAGVVREVRGGKTNVAIDVTMRGESPHQWMSGIDGRARAVVGPATLVNTKLDPTATFDLLAEAVNPFRAVNPSTELQCAVIRLPFAGGVAQIDRSIAMETKQVDAAMSGTLDFRNETVDLSIRPRVRQGIPIEIPQIAELVRFRGSFAAPTVTVDAVASATAIARVGAAIGTGGLSILGESILAQGVASAGTGACATALGKAGPATASAHAETAKRAAAPTVTDDLGKALKGLFGR